MEYVLVSSKFKIKNCPPKEEDMRTKHLSYYKLAHAPSRTHNRLRVLLVAAMVVITAGWDHSLALAVEQHGKRSI